MVAVLKIITKLGDAGIIQQLLVYSFCLSGVCSMDLIAVLKGENVTLDCGFQTTVIGENLLWQVIINDSEIPFGHIVPGDHFCGIDTIDCTLHNNGSITLVDVGDGDKYLRCLRGDEEGYHYFSDLKLTVLSKESMGHPVIQPLTGSIPNVYKIGEKGVIHSYEEPTCEDKEDGALVVTCYPPSGVMVDKVYDHVHCNCTDSDGNTNSLNITVNSLTELTEHCAATIHMIWFILITVLLMIMNMMILTTWSVRFMLKRRKQSIHEEYGRNQDEERHLPLRGRSTHFPGEETETSTTLGSAVDYTMKNEEKGFDEPSFAAFTYVGADFCPLWKEYLINDSDKFCKGFDLEFTCEGPGLKIELRESEIESENICSIDFSDSVILFKIRNNPEEKILVNTEVTKYGLLLGRNKTELNLYQGSVQNQQRLICNVDMKNRKFHLLCMYKNNACKTSILDSAQLTVLRDLC